jgi:hypothetical protein
VVGADGILRTQDGGANWIAKSTTPKRYFASAVFPAPQSGWITGGECTICILKTAGALDRAGRALTFGRSLDIQVKPGAYYF